MPPVTLILVKHAQPRLDAAVPPREWRLGEEGVAQSEQLAARLKIYLPFRLVCSAEPKAEATAQMVARALGVDHHVVEGLEEIDRYSTPIVARAEHVRTNAALFADRTARVVGTESADEALVRFSAAIEGAVAAVTPPQSLVVISHGTVISLFVEQRTHRNAFDTWRTLECGDYLQLRYP